MISEVDLRDWDRVDFQKIEQVLEDGTYLDEKGHMWNFVQQVFDVYQKQIKTIPALLRKQ